MAANPPDPTQQLYLAICLLAHTETQLALAPMPPFAQQDRQFLRACADQLGELATQFRQADPAKFVSNAIAAAAKAVSAAQKSVGDVVAVVDPAPPRNQTMSDMLSAAAAVGAAIPG